MTDTFPKYLRTWGPCRQCGGKSAGELFDNRNGSLGPHCAKCAKRRIAGGIARPDEKVGRRFGRLER